MSLELVNAFATLGTFVVIAATAIAAIVQLRHARSSNHIAALNELRETMESADFLAAQHFVQGDLSSKLNDPTFRYQIETPAVRTDDARLLIAKINAIGNFCEGMGVLVKMGLIDRELVMQMWTEQVTGYWSDLEPVTAIHRRRLGNAIWENFEYLTVLAQDWLDSHPKGSYPAGTRRIEPKDQYLEADKQYAASLAPA